MTDYVTSYLYWQETVKAPGMYIVINIATGIKLCLLEGFRSRSTDRGITVSYTHLDVYKRQGLENNFFIYQENVAIWV